ncbi:hypothetical protein HZS55_09075 [Halosimplex rubrum]|uniref:Uncharacterized protein n=1 Tax=Halosimplex rubrum TaxID=869889 RepID=A0A7D5TCN3_9EURY|nr:hypothetical protein [Halosimplex rubrum]QLH77436.1 hypothetical protein HZS55_09075 [Halosimplex rubrum]
MATNASTAVNGIEQTDDLPAGWERLDDDQLPHGYTEAFEHDSGLRVTIESMSRPTQMADPMTATDESGYVARVRDDVGADLSHTLVGKQTARDAALAFIDAHPDADFEMPDDRERHGGGPIDWRGE